MSWKAQMQLSDLPDGQRIEVTCKKCAMFRYDEIADLVADPRKRQLFLDEYEARATCLRWGCKGACRIALPADSDTEGFQGGLA